MDEIDIKNIIYQEILPECMRREGMPIMDGEEFSRMIAELAGKALKKKIPEWGIGNDATNKDQTIQR